MSAAMSRVRKLVLGIAVVVSAAAVITAPVTSAQPGAPAVPAGVVDIPVEFRVVNVNQTQVPCSGDGGTYTIAGHLTAPRDQLDGDGAITLYEHGIAGGEWYWRLPVAGYHHSYEMAARGHASLTIDRLGYDRSDAPAGTGICMGSQATMAHQIVQALRSGDYVRGDGAVAPRFDKVFLAGQSNGGQLAEIEAYSFHDVDSIILMAWVDRGLTPEVYPRFFVAAGQCAAGGSAHEKDPGKRGYVYFDQGREEFETGNFDGIDPAVLATALPLQNQHPCGDMMSQGQGLALNLAKAGEITVPVLGMYGERDRRVTAGMEAGAYFTSAPETKAVVIAGAGHYIGQSVDPSRVFDPLADWLDKYSG